MIEVKWQNDRRKADPYKYVDPEGWEDNKGRLSAFLAGWTNWAENSNYAKDVLHWHTVGALYASAFGSREAALTVPEAVRCRLYHVALISYLKSTRTAHWSDEDRERALALSLAEVERRAS